MLRTNLDAWRATLFVSLGLAASGCAGKAESLGADAESNDASGEEAAEDFVSLPEHLRCQDDAPTDVHGILSPRRHAELRRAAIIQIVLPCAEGLLAAGADAHVGGRSGRTVMQPAPA